MGVNVDCGVRASNFTKGFACEQLAALQAKTKLGVVLVCRLDELCQLSLVQLARQFVFWVFKRCQLFQLRFLRQSFEEWLVQAGQLNRQLYHFLEVAEPRFYQLCIHPLPAPNPGG